MQFYLLCINEQMTSFISSFGPPAITRHILDLKPLGWCLCYSKSTMSLQHTEEWQDLRLRDLSKLSFLKYRNETANQRPRWISRLETQVNKKRSLRHKSRKSKLERETKDREQIMTARAWAEIWIGSHYQYYLVHLLNDKKISLELNIEGLDSSLGSLYSLKNINSSMQQHNI
jgi:hypothetical protein